MNRQDALLTVSLTSIVCQDNRRAAVPMIYEDFSQNPFSQQTISQSYATP
ncbi:hypothetical protein [Spirosoma telluris]